MIAYYQPGTNGTSYYNGTGTAGTTDYIIYSYPPTDSSDPEEPQTETPLEDNPIEVERLPNLGIVSKGPKQPRNVRQLARPPPWA
jgi:hypothetical protein